LQYRTYIIFEIWIIFTLIETMRGNGYIICITHLSFLIVDNYKRQRKNVIRTYIIVMKYIDKCFLVIGNVDSFYNETRMRQNVTFR